MEGRGQFKYSNDILCGDADTTEAAVLDAMT